MSNGKGGADGAEDENSRRSSRRRSSAARRAEEKQQHVEAAEPEAAAAGPQAEAEPHTPPHQYLVPLEVPPGAPRKPPALRQPPRPHSPLPRKALRKLDFGEE